MGLIYCSECGKQISNKAKVCPNCGAPREKHPHGKFFDSWNTLLPNEKASIKKSLIYTLISATLMLLFVYLPIRGGLLQDYDNLFLDLVNNRDKILDTTFEFHIRKLLKISFWNLVWGVLFFSCIIKTYLKSGFDGKKPISSQIGLVRCVVFCVICIIACIHYAKAYFAFFESLEGLFSGYTGAVVTTVVAATGTMGKLATFIIIRVNCIILAFSFFAFIAALEIAGALSNLTDGKASTCPDCGNIIDESDLQCPNCGYPFEKQTIKTSIKTPLILVAAAIVLGNLYTIISVAHINQEVQRLKQAFESREIPSTTYY